MSSGDEAVGRQGDAIADAFPNFAEVDVEFAEVGHDGALLASGRMNASSLVARLKCSNPNCARGGFDLHQFLRSVELRRAEHEAAEWACPGDGGRPGVSERGCTNRFVVRVGVRYRPIDDDPDAE
jgi:hypothetical protein